MDILVKLLLGIGLAGAVGGPYILFLAYFRPRTFPKPGLAKKQGLAAFLIGAAILLIYFHPWQ
jgi:hypothetical protein